MYSVLSLTELRGIFYIARTGISRPPLLEDLGQRPAARRRVPTWNRPKLSKSVYGLFVLLVRAVQSSIVFVIV